MPTELQKGYRVQRGWPIYSKNSLKGASLKDRSFSRLKQFASQNTNFKPAKIKLQLLAPLRLNVCFTANLYYFVCEVDSFVLFLNRENCFN